MALLLSLCGVLVYMLGENNYMCFFQTCSTPLVDKVDIVLIKDDICILVDVILLIQHKRIYLFDPAPRKDLLFLMRFKPKNGPITTNTLPIDSSP
jgi:hypothetical protein